MTMFECRDLYLIVDDHADRHTHVYALKGSKLGTY